jgi:hypothetical protein
MNCHILDKNRWRLTLKRPRHNFGPSDWIRTSILVLVTCLSVRVAEGDTDGY